MTKLIPLLLVFLAGCGGGDLTAGPVTVHVEPGAITCNNCSVTLGPMGVASAPVASAPVVPPVSKTPLGVALNTPGPLVVPVGQLAWTSGGMGYALIFRDAGFAQFAMLVSTSAPTAAMPTWINEILIDDAIDLHPPGNTDAAIRAYLAQYVLPKLNAWLTDNSGRFADGFVMGPASSASVPATWAALDRMAALAPQWIVIVNGQAVLK